MTAAERPRSPAHDRRSESSLVTLRRTVRAIWWGWKAEFSGAAEYRADLLSGTLVSAIWLGVSVSPMLVVAGNQQAASGWTLPRLLLLQAVWYLLDGIVWMIVMVNARRLSDMVRDGSLDAVLLRPVDSLLTCTLGHLYVQDCPKIGLAAALGAFAVASGGGPATPLAAVAAVVAVGSAVVLMWAIGVLVCYKSLTHVRSDAAVVLFALHDLARIPTPLYGPLLHLLLTVVIPIGFLTTVPAEVFFGTATPWWALASVALSGGVAVLTHRLWHRELLDYSGAMS